MVERSEGQELTTGLPNKKNTKDTPTSPSLFEILRTEALGVLDVFCDVVAYFFGGATFAFRR